MFTGVGAEILQTPYRTPIADAHAERFVRIVRSGCLDHLLVEDERHLKRVLRSYSCHYNSHRPIRGSAKACPERPHLRSISWRPGVRPSSTPPQWRRAATHRLGGLIHEYERVA